MGAHAPDGRRSRLAAGLASVSLCLVALGAASQTAQLKPGIVSVTGDVCVGVDCVDGEIFLPNAHLRLKENNTRLAFLNTESTALFGNHWVLEANDSGNGGPDVIRWIAQSLTQDSVKLSDGRGMGPDCEVGDTFESPDFSFQPPLVTIPVGMPILRAQATGFESPNYIFECQESPWFTEYQAISIGTGPDDIIALGYNSVPVSGVVTVGNSMLSRVIANVGTPVAGSDMLPAGMLTVFPEKKAEIMQLRKTIAVLKEQLTALENADADADNVPNIDDEFPTDPTESVDTDGDGVGDNADAFPEDPTETLDSDGDGVGDNLEGQLGTGINVPDSDGDGFFDGEELENETDPLDPNDFPLPGLNIPLIWKALEE